MDHGRPSARATRREFLAAGVGSLAATALPSFDLNAQVPGERPKPAEGLRVLNPMGRVPVSLIIDDSTCLANLSYFAIPQFAEVFPDRYKQDWRKLPHEIPDRFVAEFAEWCQARGIKGKYSMVPYPACVGWLDRELPGWTHRELRNSIKLVQDVMVPDWDIHPEMVTHTRIIDTKTGRPFPERTEYFMENWRWTDGKSVSELADYMAYALRVLKNIGLPCEGITTPGGFGNRVLPELALATLDACRDVFKVEIPHYFRHVLAQGKASVAPRVEFASGLDGPNPKCVVSIVGCTGDWFGGWDGLQPGSVDRFITADLQAGRLVEVIDRGEPAVMVCHWPGIYYNGDKLGFNIFKGIVERLQQKYDHLVWMKLSELARYWAAKELTRCERQPGGLSLQAPFAADRFTLEIDVADNAARGSVGVEHMGSRRLLTPVQSDRELKRNTAWRTPTTLRVCLDLPRGSTTLHF
jgi:hypothetical protein